MYKYFEIVRTGDGPEDTVVKRLDVTTYSNRQLERLEDGANINLNHEAYYTRITDSETELPEVR